ncbi:MAG: PaaI family thioesterase [Gammaproteobacteria bacterium]|nr:PaaI family thioesterase [Planctomycetota bacterium]MCP5198668.1 PaaI family thioesterase [Gammaproteobacteria bacterium]
MTPQLNPRAVDKLERIRDGREPYPPMWETVPVSLLDYEPGCIRMTTRADARHVNALGTVHGGFAATVLDTALGLTVFISIDGEARHTTVDLAVKIVRPIPLETDLVAETRLVHVSRSVGVSQGVLRDTAGVVYAHGTTTCHIKR